MALICGVDEAGRGPLAGPVTAAAVILPETFPVDLLADSKRLTARRRERLAETIKRDALAWGLGWASHAEIDEINILRASLLAMERALAHLTITPDRVVVDGLFVPRTAVPAQAVIKADATVPAVMAASILAKTARDLWMSVYAVREPQYGFERHKGYPTLAHRESIRTYGPSPIHRRTFRLV